MREFAVIGLGQFGARAARTLTEQGGVVIGVDRDLRRVEELKDDLAHTIAMDSTDEGALRGAGMAEVETAVVALGSATEASIMTTALLQKLGVGHIVARANSRLHERILRLVGAREVYNPEEQMADQVARAIISPDVHEVIPLATGHSMVELTAPDAFSGKTLAELQFRARFGLNIVALKKRRLAVDDQGAPAELFDLNDLPGPDDVIRSGDILLVVGSDARIRKLEELR